MPDKITLTRQELYEKVWSSPMQKLAREFGLSDVGLAKLCRRHYIPVPGRGYWARLAVGQKPGRVPLPPSTDLRLDIIELHLGERPATVGIPIEEKQSIPVIEVAEDRPITHFLALEVQKSILTSADDKGVLLTRKGRVVPVHVSAGTLPRALRNLDALFAAIEGAGHTLAWLKPYDKEMTVAVHDEALGFSIVEVVKAKPHELRPQEKASPWMAPRWDYVPTGILKLSIDCSLEARVRHSWSDGKKRRIENCLGHFLVTLPMVAATLKKEREERAERERRWAEERKREEEAQKRREEYNRKAKALDRLAESWHASRRLHEFAGALKAAWENPETPEDRKADLAAMAEFALRHANYLDPLTDLKWMLNQFKTPPWQWQY